MIFNVRYLPIIAILASQVTGAQTFKTKNVVDHWEMVAKATDTWQYWPGTTEPDSNWRLTSFNASSWQTGKGGFGFGDGDDSTTISTAATSVYVRKVFVIKDTSQIYDMLLALDYDDGFVAWLNGKEITRRNLGMKGSFLAYDSLATASREATMYQSQQPEYFVIAKSLLNKAKLGDTNVLCIQVHNAANSADMSCVPFLFAGINDATTNNYLALPSWFTPPFTTHLPLFYINTNGQGIPDNPAITADMGVVDNGKDQNHLGDPFNGFLSKIKIETRGSSSQGFPQRQYAMTTCDSNGGQLAVKLLGFPKESDWILYASYTDKSMMRNTLAYYMSREMGWYASRTRFIEVIINGQYVGVYELMEKLKLDNDRVDLPDVLSSTNKGDSITGGYLMKVDRVKQSGLGVWTSPITSFNSQAKNYSIQTVDPDIPNITQPQVNYIKNWMDSFELNLNSALYSDPAKGYHTRIDANSFIDFYIVNEVSKNIDGYRLSNFMYKQRKSLGGRLYAGPVWDFNLGFGNANYCNGWDTTTWNDCGYSNIPFWFEKLLRDNNYKRQFKCRWTELRKGLLKTQNISNYIDSTAEYLSLPAKRHFAKWQILGTYVWPNWYIGNTYQEEVNWLKKYVRGRMNWMDKNMPNVVGSCNSTFTNFVRCTEINYNCHPKLNGGNWIELHNRSVSPVSVGNFVLTDNSAFRSYTIPAGKSIPAGGYLVIVEDTAAFRKVYPSITNIVGPTNWGLENDGGTFNLYDHLNFLVFKLTYNDKNGWPTLADGKGRTLELVDPTFTPNNPVSWFAGCMGGSPGRAYTTCGEKLVVSEINYSSNKNADAGDWIELYNADTLPRDLKGITIKDNNDSNIYLIKQNIALQPKSYWVFCADTTKFDNIYPTIKNRSGNLGFGLGANGDAVRLIYADSMVFQEIYYADSAPFPYGAKGTGHTIEYIGTDNNSLLASNWALSCYLGSPGRDRPANCSPNSNVRLNLTELHLWDDPKAPQGLWLELYNQVSSNIDLSNWILKNRKGQIVHQFVNGSSLAQNSYLLLSSNTGTFIKYHAATALQTGNFVLAENDTLLLIDTFGLEVMKIGFDVSGFELAKKLYRSVELIHPDSDASLTTNWMGGCVDASPGKAYQACVPINLVSEICYKNQAGQWLEMYNSSSTTVDWSGAKLYNANNSLLFEFPAGSLLQAKQRVLLVADSSSFRNRFVFINFFGKLQNSLADSLETLRMIDAGGRVVYSSLYKSNLPFDSLADGWGYTLELLADTVEPTTSNSWLHSCPDGTPGFDRSISCNPTQYANICFAELNPNPEGLYQQKPWIELYNDGDSVDLSGWGIMNANGVLYSFGQNTFFAKKTYMVLAQDSIDFITNYGIVASGIWSGNMNNLSDSFWLIDYFGNKASQATFSTKPYFLPDYNGFGKTLEASGLSKNIRQPSDYNAATCYLGSPGKSSGSCDDSIIVSEINYHSADTLDAGDWLELYNPLQTAIDADQLELRIGSSIVPLPASSLPPDSFLVISADSVKFRSEFPGIMNVVFIPTLSLSDTSSRIFIYKSKNLQHSLQYDKSYEALASGGSYTLESMMSTIGHYQKSDWTIGCPGGSPGHRTYSPCDTAVNGITNSNSPTFQIIPNPASDIIYLMGNPARSQHISIQDMNGKQLLETKWHKDGQAIFVGNLAAGVYLVRIESALYFRLVKY
ncbi:MAG: T9SS type A sorting domain-containing protein [Flavobacteriaceae bacterium]|nr:T9SS type A sorting domain-containing protein [Flavobacteriaceae bacterium]